MNMKWIARVGLVPTIGALIGGLAFLAGLSVAGIGHGSQYGFVVLYGPVYPTIRWRSPALEIVPVILLYTTYVSVLVYARSRARAGRVLLFILTIHYSCAAFFAWRYEPIPEIGPEVEGAVLWACILFIGIHALAFSYCIRGRRARLQYSLWDLLYLCFLVSLGCSLFATLRLVVR
jgi:hypothetical protein